MLYQNILQKWNFKYIGIFINIKKRIKKKIWDPAYIWKVYSFSTLKFILSSIHAVSNYQTIFNICRPFKLFSILRENSAKFWIASLGSHHTNWTLKEHKKGIFSENKQKNLYVRLNITWHLTRSWVMNYEQLLYAGY